jgi:hypothetical protein
VAWLREHGWPDARRTLAGDGRQSTDIDGVPGVAIEVKARAASAWPTWCAQAIEAAPVDAERIIVVRRTVGNPNVGEWEARWMDRQPAGSYTYGTVGTFAEAMRLAG